MARKSECCRIGGHRRHSQDPCPPGAPTRAVLMFARAGVQFHRAEQAHSPSTGGTMRGALLRAILTVIAVLGCAISSPGQAVNNAQIHGTVTDATGAAVVGARVTATQATTGLVRVTVTGASGDYSLPNLPVGPYRLEVAAQGFQNYVQT